MNRPCLKANNVHRTHCPVDVFAVLRASVLTVCFSTTLGAQGPSLERLEPSLVLPENLTLATDVRWLNDGIVLLGVEGRGVYSWRLGEDEGEPRVSLAATDGYHRGFESYSRVGGASAGRVVFAGGLFGVYEQGREDGGVSTLKPIEIVGDVDRRGLLTAAVGLSRTEDGSWEDHIAWLFRDGESEPRKLLPTRDGGESMGHCWHAEVSAIRFISDERVLVVPGLEPGVFVYDLSGSLVEALTSETFSADTGCGLEPERGFMLGQAAFTIGWMAGRRLIDEVVADGSGNVYFFVRHVPEGPEGIDLGAPAPRIKPESSRSAVGQATVIENGATADGGQVVTVVRGFTKGAERDSPAYDASRPPRGRVCWDLVHAPADELAAATTLPCAVESEFADARLRADLRGNTAIVLLTGFTGALARPAALFEARIEAPGS